MSLPIATPKPRSGGPGLPPVDHDRHYGGGGDRGDRGSDRDRLLRYRMGLAAALVSVVILFGAALLAFLHRYYFGRWDLATSRYVRDWQGFALPITLLAVNTLVLAASSFAAEKSRSAAASAVVYAPLRSFGIAAHDRAVELWAWLSAALGAGFLAGQYAAWNELASRGLPIAAGPSTTFFYLLTGTHAAHVVVGVLALIWAGVTSALRRPLEWQRIATDLAAWYWHALGVLWLAVFAILYTVSR